MSDIQSCPNCNASLVNGTALVSEDRIQAINLFTTNKSSGFCNKCFPQLATVASASRSSWIEDLKAQVQKDLVFVPVITLQAPYNWEYTLVKLVTAQTVTGAGVITEITNDFYEIFGMESPRMENKLKKGEDICISRLRIEAISSGANAVIAADIDYAQLDSPRADMLMVCMSGTAIKINNVDILPTDIKEGLARLQTNMATLNDCYRYKSRLA